MELEIHTVPDIVQMFGYKVFILNPYVADIVCEALNDDFG